MTIISSVVKKESVALVPVPSLGRAAGRRRLQPRARLEVLELFPDGQIAGVFCY